MKNVTKFVVAPVLALTLAACGTTSNSKKPKNFKTPSPSPSTSAPYVYKKAPAVPTVKAPTKKATTGGSVTTPRKRR